MWLTQFYESLLTESLVKYKRANFQFNLNVLHRPGWDLIQVPKSKKSSLFLKKKMCNLLEFTEQILEKSIRLTIEEILSYFLAFFLQHKLSSVDAKMCEMVPNRWNNMAVNWITRIRAKKNTNTKPMGSSCRYSLVMITWGPAKLD